MKDRREDPSKSSDSGPDHDVEGAPPDATRTAMADWSSAQAGGAVAPGVGHGAAHRAAMGDWSSAQVGATRGLLPTAAGLFEKVTTAPGGALVTVSVEAARLPPEMATLLGVDPSVTVEVQLTLIGGELAVVVAAGAEVLVAKVDLAKVLEVLAGPAGAQIAELLPAAQDFAASAAGRFGAVGDGRVKIHLWGDAKDASFVVIDLARALRGAWQGNLAGLRPVEARLATKAGRVEQFADDQVKMGSALPDAADALGDLEVAAPALRKGVLGLDDEAPVHATVYYKKGKLAIAIKPDAKATTGVVAEIDLAYLVNRLRALGDKVAELLKKLLPQFEGGDRGFLDWNLGSLKFDLGGKFASFFAFDFRMLLPRLGGGGGFDLGALWPTSWSFELPGLKLGTLPKLSVPWLKWPKLGSFDVDLGRLTGLFSGLGLPSLPSLPSVEFDLHFRKLELGLALDLGKLWPDLDWGKDGPSTFGLDLDLSALLEVLAKAGGAIAKAARWLLDKLRGAGDAIKRWIHPGGDGVIRIFDGNASDPAKTSMLGFSLLRLFDGAQATDLAPVEIRYHGADADLELGQAVGADADLAAERGRRAHGAAAPQRPKDPMAQQDGVVLPARVIETLGLAPGAKGYLSVAGAYPDLIAYAEAKSGHRDGDEGLRLSVDVERLVAALAKKLPAGGTGGKPPKLPTPQLDGVKIGEDAALEIRLGEKADLGEKPVPYARAAWRLHKLLGAQDLSALIPDEIDVQAPGTAGVTRGPFTEPGGLIGQRFGIEAPDVRRDVLGVADGKGDVFLGVYFENEVLALTATPEKAKHEGLLGHVNVVTLLEQLKKLGALGERVLDAIGSALGAGVDKLKGFGAKIAAIAAKIGHGLMALVDGVLRLKLPDLGGGKGGGWIGWDLSRLAPNISLQGFSLEGLIPDFSNLSLPGLPGFSLSWLPKLDFDTSISLGKIPFSTERLKKLFSGLELPDLDFDFEVFGLDDFHLGLSIDLSFLDGALGGLFPGGHKLGFQLDLARILGPLERAWAWLQSRFPKGKAKPGGDTHVKLGGDGVLRMWDDQAHIGFALKNLLDGFQPSDIVPVEMSLQVTTGGKDGKPGDPLATMTYGQAVDKDHKAPAKPEEGQVLAERPKGKTWAEAKFDAPEMVRTHLGAPKGADLDVDLIEVGKHQVALYATVTGSDRGLVMQVQTGAIERLVQKIGPKAPSDLGAIEILWDQCRAAKGLVIGFGEQPGAKTKQQDVKPHGYARWRMARFFDGLELGDLVPDEAHLGMAEGGMSVGVGIDVKGLKEVATIDVPSEPSWIRAGLGSERATVYSNASEKELRMALVAAAPDGDAKQERRGVELDVAGWFLDDIEAKVAKAAKDAGTAVGNALKKTAGAGKRIGGDLSDKRIGLQPTPAGLRLQRGKDGDADHLYATFGWTGLVDAVTKRDLAGLVPVELRLATGAVALEIEDAATPSGGMPKDAKRIGAMHALFKDALGAFGLSGNQFLELDLGKSPVEELSDGSHNVNLVGMIYTPEQEPPQTDHAPGIAVSDAQKVTLSVSLEALLAQVLPRQRKFANQKKHAKAKDGGTKMSLGVKRDLVPEEEGDQMGVGLDLSSSHTSKKTGKTRTIEVQAGWTAEKLIEILMNLDDIVGADATPGSAVGLLTPDVVRGSFENHLFKMSLGNRGAKVGTDIKVGDLPILPEIMSAFVDRQTADETVLWIEVPGADEIASNFGKALLAGDYVKLGQASIEMPGAEHPFGASLSLSMAFLETLAGFIPYVGLAIKIIRGVQGLLRDPKGTAESLLYTPELLYHVIDNAGDIYDKLSDMSVKDIALAFMSGSDVTTKQAVYLARLKKKMGKGPDGKPIQPVPSAEELEWLNRQSKDNILKAEAVYKRLDELGMLPPEDAEGGAPTQDLDFTALEELQAAADAGFRDLVQAREAQAKSPDDPAAKAALEAAEQKFRKDVARHIKAGAKSMERETERETTDQPGTPQPQPSEDEQLTRVDELPEPDPDRLAEAQQMFKQTPSGGMDPTREAYLIQKFAVLTTAQLADILENKTVKVEGKNGPMELPLWPSEEPFARELFVLRIKKEGMTIDKNPDLTVPAATSEQIVQMWRNRNAKQADQDKKDAKKAAKDKAAKEKAAKDKAAGGGGGGAKEEGEGEDGGSLDEEMWGEEPEDATGSGESGQGLDKDGDGKLSKDELADKKPGAKDAGDAGDTGGGGTTPAEPEKIDDERLWTPTVNDAHNWVTWDAATQTLVRNQTAIDDIVGRGLTTPTAAGETATLTAIETEFGGNTGHNRKIMAYTITLVATTASGKTVRSMPFAFYHDVKDGKTFSPAGGDEVIMAVHNTFAIKGDKAVLRAGPELKIGKRHFNVARIEGTRKSGQDYIITVALDVVEVPPDTKVRNKDNEWQVINNGDKIDMTLPYMHEEKPE